jgi:hypothetical protein
MGRLIFVWIHSPFSAWRTRDGRVTESNEKQSRDDIVVNLERMINVEDISKLKFTFIIDSFLSSLQRGYYVSIHHFNSSGWIPSIYDSTFEPERYVCYNVDLFPNILDILRLMRWWIGEISDHLSIRFVNHSAVKSLSLKTFSHNLENSMLVCLFQSISIITLMISSQIPRSIPIPILVRFMLSIIPLDHFTQFQT